MPKQQELTSFEELEAAGYVRKDEGQCRSCKSAIVWFTTPRGKSIPWDADGKQSHFATCPDAAKFRRK